MDKDYIVLKAQKEKIHEINEDLKAKDKKIEKNTKKLQEMNSSLDSLLEEFGYRGREGERSIRSVKSKETRVILQESSYDEVVKKSINELEAKGIDFENLLADDLLDADVIRKIDNELDRPLPRNEKWTRDDKVIVFAAATVGTITDLILSNRDNKFTGTNSDLSEWLTKFHKHREGSPLDYQGEHFGGGDHRVLSRGHDLFRMVNAIMQIKNGRFEGVTYNSGVAETITSTTNQYGTPYEQMKLIEAIGVYFEHMKGDFFSKKSLPVPGYSFFMESSNRELRVFAATMYKQGFNMKNVAFQAISTVSIELILRIYFAVVESKKLIKADKSINIFEDYSNIDNIKNITMPASNEKYREMFLLTHALVTAVNIGKVVIKKAPWEINITEILMTIRYLVPYLNNIRYRHSDMGKIIRNTENITATWDQMAIDLSAMPKGQLVIG